jgi:tetratricopeptide (TPR) repeat protein
VTGPNRFPPLAIALVALNAGVLSSSGASGQTSARFADLPQAPPPRAPQPGAAPRSSLARSVPPPESWATLRAREFVLTALRYEQRGDTAFAAAAYMQAIRVDSSYGPAYLGLARLRELAGDWAEAERLYNAALPSPEFAAEALTRRARLRRRLGRQLEALADLETAWQLEPDERQRARELAGWYAERRAWPAALAVWRQLLDRLERDGSAQELAEARLQVRALGVLAGDSDPVAGADPAHPSWVRRALTSVARRTGH